MSEIDNCPYCIEPLEQGSIVNFQCNHFVHYTCFVQAIKYDREHNQETRCPLCRMIISDATLPAFYVIQIVQRPEIITDEHVETTTRSHVSHTICECMLILIIIGLGYTLYAMQFK